MTVTIYRSSASGDDTGGGSFNVNRPTGLQSNDWVIFIGACSPSGGQVVSLPSDSAGTLYSSDTLKVGYKLAGAEPANYSFSAAGGAAPRVSLAAVLAYKGGSSTAPVPFVGGVEVISGGVTERSPATLAPSMAAIRLHIGFAYDTSADADITSTHPDGMKERIDITEFNTNLGVDITAHLTVCDEFVVAGSEAIRESIIDRAATVLTGLQLYIFQEPLTQSDPIQPDEGLEILLELTHQHETTGLDTTKLYSGRGVVFSGGEEYERRLMNAPEIEQRASDAVVFGGVVATTISALRLDNKDGALDAIYAYGLALGRTCVVKIVTVTDENASDLGVGAVSNASTVFSGIVAAMSPDGTTMVVQLSDRISLLDVPLQNDVYDGSADFGGGAENEGLTQPLLIGRGFNLNPTALGPSPTRETYQVHSRTIQDISNVYIRGVVQTTAGHPGVGTYAALLTDGAFELGSTPDGEVTVTAKGDATYAYANNHGEVIALMITDFGPMISDSYINGESFSLVDTVMSGEIGFYSELGDRISTRTAIDHIVRSGGIWFSGGHDGRLRLAMARPGPTESLYLTEPDIVELRPVALPANLQPAPSEISMFTERNWHPISDFAGTVTAANRRKLGGPGRTVRVTSAAIDARQAIKRHWDIIDGYWFNDSNGEDCIEQMMAFVETGLIAFRVTTDRYRGVVELGMRVDIESYGSIGPSYGLSGGFSGIVCAWREIPAKGRATMTLIGPLPRGGLELREYAGFELREDGGLELRE